MKVSITIVNYKVRKKVLSCIESIYKSKPRQSFEIIVVDNSQDKLLKKELTKIYPKVEYKESSTNVGFCAGNNLGARYAKGEYLFFLNPDTSVFKNTIATLAQFLDKDPKAGIVSPLVLGSDQKPLNMQGYRELNPINGFFTFFFLRERFRRYSFADYYSFKDWQKQPIRKVDTVYGAALMIRTELFKKLKGFDEDYFLYFEENDLSKRARKLGSELYINSNARIIHEVGQSTKQIKQRDKYFSKSRFLYFKKHFGIVQATILELLLKINKVSLLLTLLLITSLFLRLFNLQNSMVFIGDQGWFYLSARDLLVSGKIPLVGITSSHTWLHQGPLWTYMLSVVLLLSKFNPVSGAYLTGFLGMIATYLIYRVGREMFSLRIGIISAALFAVSPLIVYFDRMAFDPSSIPLFAVLYLYAIYRWIKGNVNYFPIILLLAAILYNLELATFTLVFPFALIFLYGLFKKRKLVSNLFTKRIIALSIFLPLIIMLPVIIYDFSHGFKQTIVFVGWTLYKPFSLLIKHSNISFAQNLPTVLNFFSVNLQKLIFAQSMIISLLIFLSSVLFLMFGFRRKVSLANGLLFFLLVISLAGIVVNQTPSDAYLPIVFPFVILAMGIFFDFLFSIKYIKYLALIVLIVILISNIYSSFKITQGDEFKNRIKATNEIIALSQGREYNLIGKGEGSQFRSFTMNYEYLLWWKGHPVSDKNVGLKIIVFEKGREIKVSISND